jgi:hypothetical protein
MKTALIALALAAPAATPTKCELVISYPSNDPAKITFRTPAKECDVEGMKQAVGRTLLLLNR